jgi:hypothetical protein
LHTVLLDPADNQRMYVAISAGGVYRTDDSGQNWTAQNRGIRAMTMPERYPEFGQCVHKIATSTISDCRIQSAQIARSQH